MFIDITNLRQNIGWDIELTPHALIHYWHCIMIIW